jgi:uncharacterized protein (DUF4415 family)
MGWILNDLRNLAWLTDPLLRDGKGFQTRVNTLQSYSPRWR